MRTRWHYKFLLPLLLLGLVRPLLATALDCLTTLQSIAYSKGQRTDQNRTRTDYFANSHVKGSPRFVLTVGLPGSGKSAWVAEANKNGWTVINLDSIRQELAREKREKQQTIKLKDGSQVIPDPDNPEHVFALTKEAAQLGNQRALAALDASVPIVWDGVNNARIFRAPLLFEARKRGYYTEALAFESDNLSANVANITHRAQNGGLDLVDPAKHARPEQVRSQLLQKMDNQMREQPIGVKPSSRAAKTKRPSDLRSPAGTEFLAANDFVNHIERVKVQDWSKSVSNPVSSDPAASSYQPERGILSEAFAHPGSHKIKVAFFDADGTLRITKSGNPAPNDASDVMLLPGVAEKIKELAAQGYLIAIASNQGGIPKYLSFEDADQALKQTVELLRKQGAPVHFFDFAESLDKEDPNRKPNVGMAERLERRLKAKFGNKAKIDLDNSIMVGDAAYQKATKDSPADIRPDGSPGFDHRNSDRIFAENLGLKKDNFHEPDEFFGWRKRGIRRFEKPEEVTRYLSSP